MDNLLSALRGIAEPTRLRLLALCAEGELTVTELTQILGQSQPRVSRHLKLMVEAGLLDRFPEGTWVFYRLAENTEASGIADKFVSLLPLNDPQLQRDRQRLAEVKEQRAKAAAAYFRANAAEWDRIRTLYIDETEVEKAVRQVAQSKPYSDLIDIGTGTGRILQLLTSADGHALGIDVSRDMLAIARTTLDRDGLKFAQVRQGDMYALPVDDRSFDLAVIHQVLHFADRPGAALAEAARVLRPGGRLILVDFAPHDLETLRKDHAHRRLGFDTKEIESWFRAAELAPKGCQILPGDPLTVCVWSAEKTADHKIKVGAKGAS